MAVPSLGQAGGVVDFGPANWATSPERPHRKGKGSAVVGPVTNGRRSQPNARGAFILQRNRASPWGPRRAL